MEEIWKDIPGYEGIYQISSLGRVRSLTRYVNHSQGGKRIVKERILKLPVNNTGYCYVGLSHFKNNKPIGVHRLVAIAFIPNPNNYKVINHKNNIKTDNRPENIEWCSQSYNIKYGFKMGTKVASKAWLGKFGAEHNRSKAVLQFDLNGNFIKEFGSAREAQRITNTATCNISSNCHGRCKNAGGYIWKFK